MLNVLNVLLNCPDHFMLNTLGWIMQKLLGLLKCGFVPTHASSIQPVLSKHVEVRVVRMVLCNNASRNVTVVQLVELRVTKSNRLIETV